jgi:DNA primase small subunit
MNEKAWFGADLVFDIDADHIPTSCDKTHDKWICRDCGRAHKGQVPEKCPKCKSQKLDVKSWPCEICLNSAKIETSKLVDMLTQDFGFPEKEMHVFFSGHRGYHVHVENEAFKDVDAIGRKEVVDYICGLGFDLTLHGFDDKRSESKQVLFGDLNNFGWRGRILGCMSDPVRNAQPKARATKAIERCKDSAAAKIDTVVTTDVHRLIRLPDSLHSKTGFRKVEFSLSNMNDFDPFKSAVALKKDTALVSVSDSPKFRLDDETFGPYTAQEVKLPVAAAVLLICRGRAEVVD